MDEAQAGDAGLEIDDETFAAIMAAADAELDAREGATSVPRPPVPPLPAVGGTGGPWRLADGSELNGEVTRVEGRKPYGLHVATCGRCGGRGGSNAWPGFTCYECSGAQVTRTTVRLYAPHEVDAIADAKSRRRARLEDRRRAERLGRAAGDAADFRERNAGLLAGLARHGVAERDATVADVLSRIDLYGGLTEAQVALCERALERTRRRESDLAASSHLGLVGDRVEVVATQRRSFLSRFSRPGMVSESLKHVLADRNGNVVTFKAPLSVEVSPGDVVTFVGTVKEHSFHDGVAQTAFARAKVVRVDRKRDLEAALETPAEEEAASPGP